MSTARQASVGSCARRRLHRVAPILAALAYCAEFAPRAAAQTYAERIVSGFGGPIFGAHAADDPNRMFVGTVATGRIDVLELNSRTVLPDAFLDISGDLPNPVQYEQGLLGLAFDPNYATNGHFYVHYTRSDSSIEIRRYRVLGDPATSNVADPASGQTIINIAKNGFSWHNAGWIEFGPYDGYLYVGVGDPGGALGDQAQDITDNLQGKILRLDVHGDNFPNDGSRNYAIPPSNPFVGRDGDDEIWAFGLRNLWRADFDRQTGDLWINDPGGTEREEVSYQPAGSAGGENYGWPYREGTVTGPPGHGLPPSPEYTEPVYDYRHDEPDPLYLGFVITAGALYRGPVAAFQGHYLFTDFATRNVWALDPDAVDRRASVINVNNRLLPDIGTIGGIASFGEDDAGNVYLMDSNAPPNASVWRIATASKDAIWNGNDAAAGIAGDGSNWGAASNWTRGGAIDAVFVNEDQVIFAPGASHSTINLGGDRVVSAVTFLAPYTIDGHKLRVLSGNVIVNEGVTATIRSDLSAQSANHTIRKLGGGTLLIEGDAGQVAVKEGTVGGSGSVEHLTVRSGGTVAPGVSAGIMLVHQSFSMHAGTTLAIEIGGLDNSIAEDPEFDELLVGGAAQLGGTLAVSLIDLGSGMFEPTNGDVFAILAAAGGISGTFTAVNLPEIAATLTWREVATQNVFSLAVVPRLPGDYNADGIVDAADYGVWRKSSGNPAAGPAADGTGLAGSPDGIVDALDYELWRRNFGNTLNIPASGAQVPEPRLLSLLLLPSVFVGVTCRPRTLRRD